MYDPKPEHSSFRIKLFIKHLKRCRYYYFNFTYKIKGPKLSRFISFYCAELMFWGKKDIEFLKLSEINFEVRKTCGVLFQQHRSRRTVYGIGNQIAAQYE